VIHVCVYLCMYVSICAYLCVCVCVYACIRKQIKYKKCVEINGRSREIYNYNRPSYIPSFFDSKYYNTVVTLYQYTTKNDSCRGIIVVKEEYVKHTGP